MDRYCIIICKSCDCMSMIENTGKYKCPECGRIKDIEVYKYPYTGEKENEV